MFIRRMEPARHDLQKHLSLAAHAAQILFYQRSKNLSEADRLMKELRLRDFEVDQVRAHLELPFPPCLTDG